MREVLPGIYQMRMPLPNSPLGHLNAYVLEGDDGWALIDTGWDFPGAFSSAKRQLKEKGIDLDAISQIFITHVHVDHYGLIGRLKEASGASTAFHEKEAAFLSKMAASELEFSALMELQLTENGMSLRETSGLDFILDVGGTLIYPLDPPDKILRDGDRISIGRFNFEVIWTPGHSEGHVCLYEPDKRVLLSGDHILPTITPNINVYPFSENDPLRSYLASLKRVEKLPVHLILPAHEDVFEGLQQRVGEITSHHKERTRHIMKALLGEAKTAYQIALELPWTLNSITGEKASFVDLDAFGKVMATGETLAHLQYLRGEGKVKMESCEGTNVYRGA
ncbi:MAG: MBL fold metallo-hydrolase [Thermodesulfobacteriota bacterium]|nr:MBL fold metallo-hydrolase [Thermodesulfobacteriota bacterium]